MSYSFSSSFGISFKPWSALWVSYIILSTWNILSADGSHSPVEFKRIYFISKGRIGLERGCDPISVFYSHLFPCLFELQWVRLRTSVPSTILLPNVVINTVCGYHTGVPDYLIRGTLHNFELSNLLVSSQC